MSRDPGENDDRCQAALNKVQLSWNQLYKNTDEVQVNDVIRHFMLGEMHGVISF